VTDGGLRNLVLTDSHELAERKRQGPDANRGNKRHVGRRSDDRQRTSVFVLVLIADTLALLKSPT